MAEPELVEKCVEEVGIGFMFAQSFNKSMKYVVVKPYVNFKNIDDVIIIEPRNIG